MSGSFSDYCENKVLDHLTGKAAFTSPGPLYMALCTVLPDDTSTGASLTEASYTGYARKQVATSDWNAASGGVVSNANAIIFANATGGSSTIVGWALCDSGTTGGGNVIAWGSCASTTVNTTQTPATFAAGALTISLD